MTERSELSVDLWNDLLSWPKKTVCHDGEASLIHDHGSLDLALSDFANADQASGRRLTIFRPTVVALAEGSQFEVAQIAIRDDQNRWVTPARIVRRRPNCGAPTPTPDPSRI